MDVRRESTALLQGKNSTDTGTLSDNSQILPGLLTWDDAQKACGGWNATLPSMYNRQADDALRGTVFTLLIS